jgi:hypothetical protein
MARLLTAGAETLNAIGDSKTMEGGIATNLSVTGVVTVDTGTVFSGTKSYKCDPGATGSSIASIAFTLTGTVGRTYYSRVVINWASLGSLENFVLRAGDGTTDFEICIQNAGQYRLRHRSGGIPGSTIGSEVSIPSAGTWHSLELAWTINTGATDYVEAWLNGVSFASSTTENLTDSGLSGVYCGLGGAGSGQIGYFDDWAINDSTGANENGRPSGKMVLLVPISDNSVGTGWTLGSGGTTSLFDAVNDIPPAGVADPGTTSQIRNAASNLNAYAANLTTYSTAGITAADTVNLVKMWCITAAPVTTSAKSGSLTLSNPTLAKTTFGTFYSGVNAGTYAIGWAFKSSAIQYAPSVTVGSSPVMTVTQDTSSTRIAMCCFMGLYVDYTPAAAAEQVPYTNPMPQLLAQ